MEALEVLSRVRPALIVTDLVMPKMSGNDLISAVNGKPEIADVPIIIVANKASGFDLSATRANFAIYKDIDIEAQLARALDAVLSKADQPNPGK